MKFYRIIFVLFTAFCTLFLYADDISELKQKAENGEVSAQFELGVKYYFGTDIEQNYEKAFYWTKKAAEQGEPAAEYNLGYLYQMGNGVEVDLNMARYWYEY